MRLDPVDFGGGIIIDAASVLASLPENSPHRLLAGYTTVESPVAQFGQKAINLVEMCKGRYTFRRPQGYHSYIVGFENPDDAAIFSLMG